MHLHTVKCTFDGVGMDSGYWVHEVLCMVHGLVLHSEVIQGTISSPEVSPYNSSREYMVLNDRSEVDCTSILHTHCEHASLWSKIYAPNDLNAFHSVSSVIFSPTLGKLIIGKLSVPINLSGCFFRFNADKFIGNYRS